MIRKWKVTIPTLTGREPRWAYIYVPDEAASHPDRRYPVLYMFDGHNVFFDKDATYGKSWGMKEYLEENEVPLIVAAVECNHHPDGGRLSEYSPFSFSAKNIGKITGRGKKTMDYLVGVFKPFIDSRYPTLPDREHTFLAGSSMGGLMTLYGVMAYNAVFSRGAALSPSVWVAPRRFDRMLQTARLHGDTALYLDYGEKEIANHRDMLPALLRCVTRLCQRGVSVSFRIVPGGTHCEASWEKQIPSFMQTLFYRADEENPQE